MLSMTFLILISIIENICYDDVVVNEVEASSVRKINIDPTIIT